MRTLTIEEFRAMRAGGKGVVIDVLTEGEFARQHVAGAVNACVYNMDFAERCKACAPSLATPLAVYGSSVRSQAAATAAGKLEALGYTDVAAYLGGSEEWSAAGGEMESDMKVEHPRPEWPAATARLKVDREQSRIEWSGRSFTGKHDGTLRLAGGWIDLQGGAIAGAVFTIDMRSLENRDIADSAMRQMLIAHLSSDDFFDVEAHPEAEFRILRATPMQGTGVDQMHVHGELTLKGRCEPVQFPCRVSVTDGTVSAEGECTIDRTRWDVLYGSGKFYEKLGKHFVDDAIELRLVICAS